MRVIEGTIIVIFFSIFTIFAQEDSFKKRDPFSPLISKSGQILIFKEKENLPLILKGIIYSPPTSYAIISDQVVRENSKIFDYTVISIEEKRVILKKNEEEIILKMEEK